MTPAVFYALVGAIFGYSVRYGSTFHTGVDFPWGRGTAIPAFASGRVAAKGYNDTHGNWVSIIVGSTYFHFCHLVEPSTLTVGQLVTRGRTIGYVGMTGAADGYHLHLAASNQPIPGNGVRRDPLPLVQSYLAGTSGSSATPGEPTQGDDMPTMYHRTAKDLDLVASPGQVYASPNRAVTIELNNQFGASKALDETGMDIYMSALGVPRPAWSALKAGEAWNATLGIFRPTSAPIK